MPSLELLALPAPLLVASPWEDAPASSAVEAAESCDGEEAPAFAPSPTPTLPDVVELELLLTGRSRSTDVSSLFVDVSRGTAAPEGVSAARAASTASEMAAWTDCLQPGRLLLEDQQSHPVSWPQPR